jgi:hypothetical protein
MGVVHHHKHDIKLCEILCKKDVEMRFGMHQSRFQTIQNPY